MRRRLLAALVVLSLSFGMLTLGLGERAEASVAYESPYTYDQTFTTALRLLRVDMGLKITEKDTDAGYLLFEYTSPESGDRVHAGSFEFVPGKGGVRVGVQLPTMPSYHEQVLVDALVKKLQAEHGTPPRKAAPDAGAGKDDAPGDAGAPAPSR